MNPQETKARRRARRRKRVRKRVEGSPERPRLTVYRSLCHFYAQIIDDVAGRTLVAASSLSKEFRGKAGPGSRKLPRSSGGNVEAAKVVGGLLGEKAIAAGIKRVTFDRNGCKYHGRVKTFADAARKAGLEF